MITEFQIENFRSLKDVTFECLPLSFFCGPNGSGKTNIAEALDFLSKTFNNGLSYAVAEKGGFYNICFRRERRSKGSIRFRVRGSAMGSRLRLHATLPRSVEYDIEFSLRTKGEAIRSDFYVESERYGFLFNEHGPDSFRIEINRQGNRYIASVPQVLPDAAKRTFPALESLEKSFPVVHCLTIVIRP